MGPRISVQYFISVHPTADEISKSKIISFLEPEDTAWRLEKKVRVFYDCSFACFVFFFFIEREKKKQPLIWADKFQLDSTLIRLSQDKSATVWFLNNVTVLIQRSCRWRGVFTAVLFPQVLNGSLVLLLRVRGTVKRCVLFSRPRTMCPYVSTTAPFFNRTQWTLWILEPPLYHPSSTVTVEAGGGCGLTKGLQQQLAIMTYNTI